MSTVKGGGSNRRPAADRWALRGPVAAGDPPHGARVGSTPPPSRCGHARLAPRHQTVSRQLGPRKGRAATFPRRKRSCRSDHAWHARGRAARATNAEPALPHRTSVFAPASDGAAASWFSIVPPHPKTTCATLASRSAPRRKRQRLWFGTTDTRARAKCPSQREARVGAWRGVSCDVRANLLGGCLLCLSCIVRTCT